MNTESKKFTHLVRVQDQTNVKTRLQKEAPSSTEYKFIRMCPNTNMHEWVPIENYAEYVNLYIDTSK